MPLILELQAKQAKQAQTHIDPSSCGQLYGGKGTVINPKRQIHFMQNKGSVFADLSKTSDETREGMSTGCCCHDNRGNFKRTPHPLNPSTHPICKFWDSVLNATQVSVGYSLS